MGYHVSRLANLPFEQMEYFVHVIDASRPPRFSHTTWIEENLHSLAKSLGGTGGLVTGPPELTDEVMKFAYSHLSNYQYGKLEGLLCSATCLLISIGDLKSTVAPIYLIPISDREESAEAHERIVAYLDTIAESFRRGTFERLARLNEMVRLELLPSPEESRAQKQLLVCAWNSIEFKLGLGPFKFDVKKFILQAFSDR